MEPHIRIRKVNKVFISGRRETVALKDIDLDIAPGQFTCLLGPSGCGKSTLLNAVAGFSPPTGGSITVDGRPVTGPGPERGMVFQEYALFPWMTVENNIGFGLEIKGVPKARIAGTVEKLLHMLSLLEFRARYPKDLSGGMRQRVAIARVLALDSPVMLMDEPFGALDALTRAHLQDELLKIVAATKSTVVMVTHDVDEAVLLSDRIVMLTNGPAATIGDIVEVQLERPRDRVALAQDARYTEHRKAVLEFLYRKQAHPVAHAA